MKTSRRARRIQRHYSRMHRPGGLNLVSLMDIFTILVFFLICLLYTSPSPRD